MQDIAEEHPTNAEKVSLEEAEQLTARSRALSQRVSQYLRRQRAEHDELGDQVKQLQQAIQDALSRAQGGGDDAAAEELMYAKAVLDGQGPGGDLKRFLRVVNPPLLTLLVGRATPTIAWSTSGSLQMKEEYHSFRYRSAYIMFGFSSLLLLGFQRATTRAEMKEDLTFTPPLMVGLQLYLIWLLYFYVSIALRENVLQVNGSRIRSWWIRHHYWSVAACFMLLTLPVDSPAVSVYVRKFLLWTVLQSIVMVMQNRYQRRRMYTRVALGKSNAMEVMGGESSGGYGTLMLLYPLIFALQALQLAVGFEMVYVNWWAIVAPEGWLDLEPHESDLWGSRGVFFTGALMLYMGMQNFRYTALTILEKKKRIAKKQMMAKKAQ